MLLMKFRSIHSVTHLQESEENVSPYITVTTNNFSNYYILFSDLIHTKHYGEAHLLWTTKIT